jgi:hypothetical protein
LINQVAEELFKDAAIRELVGKMQPSDLQEDLLSHCIEYLFLYEGRHPGKLWQMRCQPLKGQLKAITVRHSQVWAWFTTVIRMEMTSPRSNFARKYRRGFVELEKCTFDLTVQPDFYQQQNELYELLVIKKGKQFADAAMAGLDKDAENHVRDENIKDRPKVLTPTLFQI